MRNATNRCDQILQLIDECLGGVGGEARPTAPRPWAPTASEVAELRPMLAGMAAAERARIESPVRRVAALTVAAA